MWSSSHSARAVVRASLLGGVLSAVVVATPAGAAAAPAEYEGRFERTLKVGGPVDLSVSSGSGTITITPSSGRTVRIVGTIRANRWRSSWRNDEDPQARVRRIEAQPPIEQQGDRISVGRTDDQLYRNISISYEIHVPEATMVSANTGSGSVQIGALRGPVTASSGSGSVEIGATGGAVKVSTGSGQIKVEGAKERIEANSGSGSIYLRNIAGDATAHAGSGSIEVEQTAKGTVNLTNGSGSIKAWGVRGGLVARASSGSIHVQGTPLAAWDLDTSSGSIQLDLPRDAAFDVSIRTGSGSINMDHPVTVQGTIDRRRLSGRVRGGGPLIAAHTSSGSVDINAGQGQP